MGLLLEKVKWVYLYTRWDLRYFQVKIEIKMKRGSEASNRKICKTHFKCYCLLDVMYCISHSLARLSVGLSYCSDFFYIQKKMWDREGHEAFLVPPPIPEPASQDSHGLILHMPLLKSCDTCDIPSNPSASSAVLKGTMEHVFPRKKNSFSALVWHYGQESNWGRTQIWMRFLAPNAFFQVDQALAPACLLQINSVYAQ